MTRLLSLMALALFLPACYADLGAATEPPLSVDDQVGNVIIFGEYSGSVSRETDGEPIGDMLILAEGCGTSISGVYVEGDDSISLTGSLLGSSIRMEVSDDAEGASPVFIGSIVTFERIEGAWFDAEGKGGAWDATYLPGSVGDAPCPDAEAFLEQ